MQCKIASIAAALALTASALPQKPSWSDKPWSDLPTKTDEIISWLRATGTQAASTATGTGGLHFPHIHGPFHNGTFGNHTLGGNSTTNSTSSNSTSNSKLGTVLYWGQTDKDVPLDTLCKADNGLETVVLAFVNNYGGGEPFNLNMGAHCSYTGGKGNCESVAAGIKTCQENKVKVFMSIGGAISKPKLSSDDDGKKFADELFAAFGPADGAAGSGRPFGDAVIDGFDFDIELPDDPGLAYYPAVVNQLRENIKKADKTIEISAAPICGIDSPTNAMGKMLQQAQFDKVWAQFYNDETCAPYVKGQFSQSFDLERIPNILAKGPSKDAKVYVGLPASRMASTSTEAGAGYFMDGAALQTFMAKYKGNKNMAGIMLWDSGNAAEVPAGSKCNYLDLVHSLVTTGKTC